MASTIQIKRGTGSAVPAGLEDGELAINMDNGKLYFGSGSASINSFRFENLTAENYIVSSSVTNITTQELSGSTNFGDSLDDTHTFTGHITASGDISASNFIKGNQLNIATGATLGSAKIIGNLTVNGDIISDNTQIRVLSPITASSDISASGTITATTLDAAAVSDTLAAAIVAAIDNDEIPIRKLAEDAVTVTAGTGLTGGGSITLGGSATVNVIGGTGVTANANDIAIGQDVATTANVIFNHITASGNISSSGNIISDNAYHKKIYDGTTPTETDTFIELGGSTNEIGIYSANRKQISVVYSQIVFNQAGNDVDVVIEGNTDPHLFRTNAETDRVGIGTLSPTAKLGVDGNINTNSHITASGNISASGNIIGSNIIANSSSIASRVETLEGVSHINSALTVDNATLQLNTGTTYNGGGARTISVKDGGIDSDALAANITVTSLTATNITASGNISSSGNVYGANVYVPVDGLIAGADPNNQNIKFESTSELEINSSTVTIDAAVVIIDSSTGVVDFKDTGTSQFKLDMDGTAGAQILQTTVAGDDLIFKNQGGDSLITLKSEGQTEIHGNITASGNISSSGTVTANAFVGDITGNVTGTADVATVATTVTITDNESTNENNAIIFTAGGDVDGGNLGLESDGTCTYNPSTGKITATLFEGTVSTATQGTIDHDSLANFVADEHVAHGDVSIVAGTGLTGGGTIAANRTLNVIGGDGITANANDIAITAAQTTITSLLAADIKIGEDDQTKIDFETADEIHFYANNTEQVYLADNIFGPQSDSDVDLGTTGVRWKDAFIDTITTTGAITASGNISSSGEVRAASFRLGNGAFIIDSNGDITTTNGLVAGNNSAADAHILTGKITLNGHITSSGNISSSGTVIANAFEGTRTFTVPTDTAGLHDGDVVYFGGTTSMTTGAIYHYKSDGTWELADADAVATSDGLLGVALGAASDTNGVLLRGIVTLDHDAGAIGDVLYLSTTAGDCAATAPSGTNDVVRIVGYKIFHATKKQVWFNPSSDFIIHA